MARNRPAARPPGDRSGGPRDGVRGYRRLRLSMGRHPVDLTLIAVAAGVVLACLTFAQATPVNPVETAIFTQVQRLPAWSAPGWRAIAWLGYWPGIAAAAGVALYLARIRLGIALAAAGALAWVLAVVIQLVTAPRPAPAVLAGSRMPVDGGFEFPDVHTAVLAALATAAGPYVTRRTRRVVWALVAAVALGQVFLGNHLPLGVFAGAVLGWGSGRLMHLALGAPGRRTSEEAVLVALRESGLDPARITPTVHRLLRPQEFEVVTSDGQRLQMRLVRRLRRLAGPVHRLRRAAASLETEHEPRLSTPRHEVDHEAYLTLLAERAGVGVVPVLLAGEIDRGPAFLVRRCVDGRPLSGMTSEQVDDDLLAEIWRDLARLADLHIAHHDLRAGNVLVDTDGHPRIRNFTFGRVGGPSSQKGQDVAEMLVSLTSVVGPGRSVDSAVKYLDRDTLEEALPYLQWLALHRRIRGQCSDPRAVVTELRERLAERLGVPVPSFRSPVRPSTLAMLVAGGLAVYLLLPQVSSMTEVLDSLANANWGWLAVVVVSGFLGVAASAVTVLGSTPIRLPVGKTLAVQMAAAFTGRTTAAGVGFYGVNLVFLERLGIRRTHAVGALLLNRVAMGLVAAVATGVGVLVIGSAVPVGELPLPTDPLAWVVIGAVLVAAGAVLASPFGRRRIWRPLRETSREVVRELGPVLRHPWRTVELFGGGLVFLLLSAYGLAATLSAFGVSYPLGPVLAVFIVGSTLGQIAPTPGGLGAVEAALVAGLTAIGLESADAVAAVLASRLLTFWLPVLPGVVAFRLLQHRGVV
jgi:undecaprenyl-diphosphatase